MSVITALSTIELDVVTDAVSPEVTYERFGDGRIEFTDVNGVKVVAHSNDALKRFVDLLESVD